MKKKQIRNKNSLSFGEHSKELKRRIITVLFFFIVVFVFCYINCGHVIDIIVNDGKSIGYNIIYIAPQELIIQELSLSSLVSIFITLPLILFEVIEFISPIFEDWKKKVKLYLACVVFMLLFITGLLFAYYVLVPFTYKFLYDFGTTSNIEAQISIKEYISLFITIEICIGLVMELPLVCTSLTKLGVLNKGLMLKIRPFVVITIFIIAAIITPPDVISQCIVAIPMLVLYQISIFICGFIKGGKRND